MIENLNGTDRLDAQALNKLNKELNLLLRTKKDIQDRVAFLTSSEFNLFCASFFYYFDIPLHTHSKLKLDNLSIQVICDSIGDDIKQSDTKEQLLEVRTTIQCYLNGLLKNSATDIANVDIISFIQYVADLHADNIKNFFQNQQVITQVNFYTSCIPNPENRNTSNTDNKQYSVAQIQAIKKVCKSYTSIFLNILSVHFPAMNHIIFQDAELMAIASGNYKRPK